jgi:uncharacterized protein (DUF2252 family)
MSAAYDRGVRWVLISLIYACAAPVGGAREQTVITALAEDNYSLALRDPALVAMKLAKMQRGPFEWLRGTAPLFWRDLTAAGSERPATAFGDPASSRVLLVGDPHPENVGTFRAADGTMFVDWNDFDSAGYGPYEGDVRRLAAGLVIAVADDALAADLARRVAVGYATRIGDLASGLDPVPVAAGASPYLDKVLEKASSNGDAHKDLDEVAPVVDGARAVVYRDLDPVGDDGVIENRLAPLDPVTADWVARAIAQRVAVQPELGTLAGAARRLGAGVSSYASLRYYALLTGPTSSPDDDLVLELKEERDGVIVHGVPQLAAAEWASAAARAVDAQRRLQARRDGDAWLGAAELAPLSFKVRDHAAYQRGVNASDLAALAADPAKRDQLPALAEVLGGMLAASHARALTADGVRGLSVIAPRIGSPVAFADEVIAVAVDDAAQIVADWQSMKDRDLAQLVLPVVRE